MIWRTVIASASIVRIYELSSLEPPILCSSLMSQHFQFFLGQRPQGHQNVNFILAVFELLVDPLFDLTQASPP